MTEPGMQMNQAALQTARAADAVVDRALEEAAVALHRAVAIRQFFTAENEVVHEGLQALETSMQRALSQRRFADQGFVLSPDGLKVGEFVVGPSNPAVAHLCQTLGAHQLGSLRLLRPAGMVTWGNLVSLLATAPDVVLKKGGFVRLWERTRNSDAIRLEVSPAGGRRKRKKLAPAAPGEDWGSSLSMGDEAEALANPALLARLKSFQHKGSDDRLLLELLLRLGVAARDVEAQSILARIKRQTDAYVSRQHYRPAFQVVMFLYRESRNQLALERKARAKAILETILAMFTGPFIQWLTTTVATTGDAEEAEVGEYLLRLVGERAVVYVINSLAAERTRVGRRRLVSVLPISQ